MFFVYIIYSETLFIYYKGFTTNFSKRLEYHNSGKSKYTSKTSDWSLVYLREFKTKKEALIEEKRLKRLNRESLLKLIASEMD
ncbi:putative endonuclease [Flavobacterium arsenatis]|uniref:Endonuclease n=1 Tax=Flavobacterium arsenatis TaxID=1484332 RepID=A0ABU1TTL2_9FLAO|nr:putative endonuclease [Flavobacterium arsenatis]